MAAQLQSLLGQIPIEVEALAVQEGLPRERVYEIYLAEQAKLGRGAKIVTFVPTLALHLVRRQLREGRDNAEDAVHCVLRTHEGDCKAHVHDRSVEIADPSLAELVL